MSVYQKLSVLYPVRTHLKSRPEGEFLIVMNTGQDIVYLNDTARFLYEHFDGRTTVDGAFRLLCSEYGIGTDMEDTVRTDVMNTVRDFQWQKIVELHRKSV